MAFTELQLRMGQRLVQRDLRARRKVRAAEAARGARRTLMRAPRAIVRTLDSWRIGLTALIVGIGATILCKTRTRLHARTVRAARRKTGQVRAAALEKCLVVGHRGSPVRAIENTLEAMDAAIADRADAVEVDLCLTSDGHVVLWHDWDPDEPVARLRQLGLEPGVKYAPWVPNLWSDWRRPVPELTLAELREHYDYKKVLLIFSRGRQRARIPTIDELLAWAARAPGLRTICLDVKVPADDCRSAESMAAALASKLALLPNLHCIVMSPHAAVLKAMRCVLGQRNYSLDVEARNGDASAIQAAIGMGHENGSLGRAVLVSNAYERLRRAVTSDVALLHTHNTQNPSAKVERLLVWTIDDKVEQTELVADGVHGILSNRPHQLRRIVG
jgi:glycerophosphoryl diester phosphodiesterase